MEEKYLLGKHEEILNFLLEYKEKNQDFTFSPRKNNNAERLDKGYWFQGNENYIFVPLYKRGCKYNNTNTIGFEFMADKQFIEIVYKKVENITEDEYKLYEEVKEFLNNSPFIQEEKRLQEKKYQYLFKDNDMKKNLLFFIDVFRQKVNTLLKKYALEDKYILESKEIEKRLKRIYDIKTHYDVDFKKSEINHDDSIKNIILYGAPGVGKTHNYKNLVAMIENGESSKKLFDTISKNKIIEQNNDTFNKIEQEKRVEFITFHQSYSYEDFIEGFRPNENGEIELENGIFRRIADKANSNLIDSKKHVETIKAEKKFDYLFEEFQDYIENIINKENKFYINKTVYITNIEFNAFRYGGENWGNTQRMKFSDIESLYNLNISERKEIKNLDTISGLAKQHATYFSYFMKKFFEFIKEKTPEIHNIERVSRKNYYIVIDEINRGNISKIFGELITLIEEDKRDSYEVTLPYSKEKFSVPSNLYIIATMNSTDKSIATIDIALRRRFTFLKMKPNSDLVPEIAKELFSKLNEFIKNNLSEDYQLGHSYFMKVKNEEDLEFIKEYKIKPLLEEYFYADKKNYEEVLKILDVK